MKESSSLKHKISIGKHSLEDFGVGKTHSSRYGDPCSLNYDGIHYSGSLGSRDYTRSLATILHKVIPENIRHKSVNLPKYSTPSPISTQNRFAILEGNC